MRAGETVAKGMWYAAWWVFIIAVMGVWMLGFFLTPFLEDLERELWRKRSAHAVWEARCDEMRGWSRISPKTGEACVILRMCMFYYPLRNAWPSSTFAAREEWRMMLSACRTPALLFFYVRRYVPFLQTVSTVHTYLQYKTQKINSSNFSKVSELLYSTSPLLEEILFC